MPIKQLYDPTPAPAPAKKRRQIVPEPIQAPGSATSDEPSLWRRLAGMGVRGAAGIVGAEGGGLGAAMGGLGEFGGELAEGSYTDFPDYLKRAAPEAAIGAIPLGGLVKFGRPVASMARGAAYGAVAPIIRHDVANAKTPGELFTGIPKAISDNPGEIATSAAVGAATSGVLSKLLGVGKIAEPAKVLHGSEIYQEAAARPPVAVERYGPVPAVNHVEGGITGSDYSSRAQKSIARDVKAKGQVPTNTGGRLAPNSGDPRTLEDSLQRLLKSEPEKAAATTLPPGPDITDMGTEGMETIVDGKPITYSVTSSGRPGVSAERYGEMVGGSSGGVGKAGAAWGDLSAAERERYSFIDAEKQNGRSTPEMEAEFRGLHQRLPHVQQHGSIDDLQDLIGRPKPTLVPRPSPPATPTGAGNEFWRAIQNPNRMLPAAGDVSEETRVINAPRRATNTSMTQGNVLAPDKSLEELNQEYIREIYGPDAVLSGHNPYAAVPGEGELARAIRQRGIHIDRNMANQYRGATPEVPLQGPIENSKSLSAADNIGNRAEPSPLKQQLLDSLKDRGAISNNMLMRLGLGATGAVVGAATDPLNDPVASTIAGGAVGAMSPSLLNMPKLGVSNLKDAASLAAEAQRFSYLASLKNFGANAWAAPFGHTINEGVERALAGDASGMPIIKAAGKYSPARWWNKVQNAAGTIDGRAEASPNAVSSYLSGPGRGINAGDHMVQDALGEIGISPDEAKRITATGDPQTEFWRKFVEWARAKTAGKLAVPFPRTTANLFEQGSLRMPGVRQLMQAIGAAPEAANNTRLALVQQGMGAGWAGGAGLLGSQLTPDQARLVRPYVSNLAGLYSMPANIGFGVGQAVANDKSGDPANKGFWAALQQFDQGSPLPSGLDLSPAGLARRVVPGAVADVAQLMDKDVIRTPQGFLENLKARIPGLRESVPAQRRQVQRRQIRRQAR